MEEIDERKQNKKGFFEIYKVNQLVNERKVLTIYYKRNQIYLGKKLKEQFKHAVEIEIHPKNSQELILREKSDGIPKSIYHSPKCVQKISQEVQVKSNMRFLCIWDEYEGGWRGILLPEMSDSILWENIRYYGEIKDVNITWRQTIISALYQKSWRLVDREEVESVYDIAYQLVMSSNRSGEGMFWYLILMYSYTLLNEIKKIQRRCRRVELPLSLNQEVKGNTGCTILEFQIGGEIPYMLFEIQEFEEGLTRFELIVLRWLMQEIDVENNINFGYGLKLLIKDGICGLQRKAYEYYGKDYIRSILIMKE